ncbi:PAS domain S-box protein [Modicisalibacter xianhensis]|nr:PAS domain S-box protein [Halomonas xianhensis]
MRRELEAQQAIQDLIARDEPLSGTLARLCQLMDELIPHALSTVMLFDAKAQVLRFAAGSLPAAYQEAMQAVPMGRDTCSNGRAAFLKQLVVSEDVHHDPFWIDHPDLVEQYGLYACWAYPVLSRERVLLGTYAVIYQLPGPPSRREMDLMSRAVGLVSLAIERHEMQKLHYETEQRYRSLFTLHPDGVFSLDLEGRVEDVNPAGLNLMGYLKEEILGQHYSRFIVAEDLPRVDAAFYKAAQGAQRHYEVQAVRSDGSTGRLAITNLPIVVNERVVGVYGIARNLALGKETLPLGGIKAEVDF